MLRDARGAINAVMVSYTLEIAQRYEGNDNRAFSLAIDRFYLEHPGFCPVVGGFLISSSGRSAVTFTADEKGREVRAFVYDLVSRPRFSFAYVKGSSREVLPVTPCRRPGEPQK